MTTADFISAAAIDGSVSDVTIRCKSEQEVRDRYEQMRHLAICPTTYTAPQPRSTDGGDSWFAAYVYTADCYITITTIKAVAA